MDVAIIGLGYWGPNLVRNAASVDAFDVRYVCDLDEARLRTITKNYPAVTPIVDYRRALDDPRVGAVVVATPVETHHRIACDALAAGKHVFVEKPMTRTVAEARELCDLAASNRRVLMVDHTFLFAGAVRKMKEVVSRGELGEVLYFDSVRVNLGLFQHNVNVIWDLAPHDLAIMDYVLGRAPVGVSAVARSYYGDQENLAYVNLRFSDDLIAHFHLNWLSPVKIRQIVVGGSDRMLIFDDTHPSDKIKIYDRGVTLTPVDVAQQHSMRVKYRMGDMWAPQTDNAEALQLAMQHFAHCIATGETPICDGEAGIRVVRVLEAAQASLRREGASISLASGLSPTRPPSIMPRPAWV